MVENSKHMATSPKPKVDPLEKFAAEIAKEMELKIAHLPPEEQAAKHKELLKVAAKHRREASEKS